MKHLFNWILLDIIKNTFQLSTQYPRPPAFTVKKKTYRSPFPALNTKRRNDPVDIDTA